MPHYQYCTVQKAKPRRPSTVLPRTATMNRGAANPLLGLQRSIGNRAVQRLIQSHPKDPRSLHLMGLQAKLAVGPPGNLYEQEADQVAGRVMAMPAPIPSKTLQPEGMNEEQEEPPVQSKALGASITPLGQRQTLENEAESPQMHAAITESCQANAGVEKTINVSIKRWNAPFAATDSLSQLNYNEIIQVMSDPDHMEHGFIRFDVKGGRQ